MGQFLMPATVPESVAKQVSQLSQPLSTLRQCDSCVYPFRGNAPTVALSQERLLAQKQSVAKPRACEATQRCPGNAGRVAASPKGFPSLAPVRNGTGRIGPFAPKSKIKAAPSWIAGSTKLQTVDHQTKSRAPDFPGIQTVQPPPGGVSILNGLGAPGPQWVSCGEFLVPIQTSENIKIEERQ